MTIKTCGACGNTGAVGDRYCSCEAAVALRSRIDNIPGMREVRTRIDRMLDAPVPRLDDDEGACPGAVVIINFRNPGSKP
jgi:hypothetical protein